ncbi:MAG: endolytic transglycosylase MltG [Rickettsiales bacterium]|jgi:UPF0755 protein|nr:endolytic transglycosylase MltG [Rickettsiales bacterium]
MKTRIILITLVFISMIGSSLVYLELSHYINAPNNQSKAVRLIIPRGYSVKKIAKELAKHQVIKYPRVFWTVHRVFFPDTYMQAGEYEIPPHSSVRDIIDMMHEGRVIVHKFMVPEGGLAKEVIDQVIAEEMLIGNVTRKFKDGDFLADTYHYTYGETKMMLLKRIYNKSQDIIDELWNKREANLPLSNKEEAVILASIIEKETGIESERSRIAGVFVNRLRKKIRLQADPTVIYAITQGQYIFKRSITSKDLRIKSLYNTYLYTGLPPTAICNPGIKSLEAALHPLNTKEIFFVADGKGGHNFSSTLASHNKYVNHYRRELKRKR